MGVTQSSRARRSAGLDRLRLITTWLALGGAGAVGFVGVFLAHAVPGRSSSTTGSQPTGAGNIAGPRSAARPSSGASGIQRPPQSPGSSQQTPVVVSGGS